MSHLIQQIAKHFRDLHFGNNWTCSDLKGQLEDVTWQEAITQVSTLNTIATLTYHVSYYVAAIIPVLQGSSLNSSDKLSFDHPPVTSQQDWEALKEKALTDAETMAKLIEQLPEEKLWEDFTDEKYGNYYRNICGVIEHTYYHLGQIAILKKMLRAR